MIILKKHDEIENLVIRDEDGGTWEMDSKEWKWIEFFGNTLEIGTSHCLLFAEVIGLEGKKLIIQIP